VVRRIAGHVVIHGLAGEGISPVRIGERNKRMAWVAHGIQHVYERRLGDNACKQVGTDVEHGADQQPAGGKAIHDDLAFAPVTAVNQRLRARDEVCKTKLLVELTRLEVPTPSISGPSAYVRNRVDPATV